MVSGFCDIQFDSANLQLNYSYFKMFCSNCAAKVVEGASFCHQCGSRVTNSSGPGSCDSTSSKNSNDALAMEGEKGNTQAQPTQATCSLLASGSGPPIMTFREFRNVKENARQSRFVSKSSKKRKTEEKTASEKIMAD